MKCLIQQTYQYQYISLDKQHNFQQKMGAFCQRVKHNSRQFIYRTDMFSASASLRIRGQPKYQSLLGGLLSIAMIVVFLAIFINNVISIMQYKQLSATTVESQNLNPQTSMNDLQLAFNIQGLDLRTTGRTHFFFGLTSRVYINYVQDPSLTTNYRLEKCQRKQWENLGTNVVQLFDSYRMQSMLCLPTGQQIKIYGHKSSANYSFLELTIEKCVNSSFKVCATPAQIAASLNSILTTQDYLSINLIILSATINPEKPKAVTYKLEDDIWFTFTTTLGTRGAAYFGRYKITTDQSYWPWTVQTVEQGNYITHIQTRSYEVKHVTYARFKFIRETVELNITRTYGKIDDMLSYIGGLFGLLFAFFFFFLQAYNEYCYELSIGEALFKNQQGMKSSNFTYQVYQFALIFGCNPNWTRMKEIHAARNQANQQLDVGLIMKKLNYFSRVTDILLQQHQKLAIYLTEPHSIQQMSRIRKIYQYSHDLLNEIQVSQVLQEKWNNQLVDANSVQNQNIGKKRQTHTIHPFPADNSKIQIELNASNALNGRNNNQITDINQDKQAKEILASSLRMILSGNKIGIDKKIAEKIAPVAKKTLIEGVTKLGMSISDQKLENPSRKNLENSEEFQQVIKIGYNNNNIDKKIKSTKGRRNIETSEENLKYY